MENETSNKSIEQIQKLEQYLSDEKKAELAKILDYWEKIKAEWERKKQEFWEIHHTRDDFLKLLRYKCKHENELLWKYQYWESMKWLEREKFIAEYLHDDMLYSIDIQKCPEKKVWREYYYKDWKNWNVVIEEWVSLDLGWNEIWPKWAKAIAKYLKLKEWVLLSLHDNQIWNDWAKAIIENMELKNWVTLDLCVNNIREDVRQRLKDWEKSYHDKWINCEVWV